MFFTVQDDPESEPERRVKVSYNEKPWDLDSLETLAFTQGQVGNPGYISLQEFEDYVAG